MKGAEMNAFEKIKEKLADLNMWKKYMIYDLNYREREIINKTIEIVNQVEEEFNQSLTNNNQLLTNADRIRSMTDEELAKFLFQQTYCDSCNIRAKCRQSNLDCCYDVFLAWLRSKVEEKG